MIKNLFHNSDDHLKAAVRSLSVNFEMRQLEPDVAHVEKAFIQPIISKAQYNVLITKLYGNDLSDEQTELVNYCRRATGYMALLQYLPVHNVQINASGLQVAKNEKVLPASEYRTEELKRAIRAKGHAALDDLADYIESNTAFFPEYLASAERTERLNGIVIDTLQFHRAFGQSVPQFLFLMIQKFVRDAEIDYLVPSIGQAMYDSLKPYAEDQSIGETVHADYVLPLRYAQYAVCNRAMANAIPQLNLNITEDGLVQVETTRTRHVPKGQIAATDLARQQLLEKCEQLAAANLKLLVKLLNEQASDTKYTEYFSSELYTDPEAEKPDRNENIKGGFSAAL